MTRPVRASANPDQIAFSRPFFGDAEAQAAAATVRSGWVVSGPRLAEFEQRFAAACGAEHAVGVSSWTTGAFLVLHAWGIGPGDEVIVPSLTFIATVNVIRHVGATPVFADVDAATYNLDPEDAARKITPRTRVIMPVDQIGLPCDIDAFNALARRHGLRVLDDAACAFGSRNDGRPVGSLAEVTVFSLHARKVITTGEGGMIVTDDRAFAERLRRLRHQGMSLSDFFRHNAAPTIFESYPEIGYNFRITDIQAAIGLAQLDRLDEILARRRAVAEQFQRALADHPVFVRPTCRPIYRPTGKAIKSPCAGCARHAQRGHGPTPRDGRAHPARRHGKPSRATIPVDGRSPAEHRNARGANPATADASGTRFASASPRAGGTRRGRFRG